MAAERAARVERILAAWAPRPERLLSVVGPTASGKTELAMDLAERIGGEIVSADSVQIYTHFDVGSGKPSPEEQARVRHHLISAISPHEAIDAVQYASMAEAAIADVRARGRVPILCGGTYFWVRALTLGLAPTPMADEAVRERHRKLVAEQGRPALHAELALRDPASAERLHPNDVVRVSRALEVLELSGKTMTEFHAEHGFRDKKFDALLVAPGIAAPELTDRIRTRAERWLTDDVFLDEVRGLIDAGFGDARPMRSVGYKEVRAHLDGEIPRAALLDVIVQNTRTFTRRQRTWLGHADVLWV